MDSKTLSIKNASGKTFSLLNESNNTNNSRIMNNTTFKVNKLTSSLNTIPAPKRKYHCTDSGCNKSFTTSGHLARHNRIHTGEKNFHCLHPGCPSRFSRQDNMMQHYRTHLSQKLKRQHMRQQQQQQRDLPPQLYHHSYYGNEDILLFQPLVQTNKINRSRRSMTMPSLPYPPPITASAANTKVVNRPRRALSTCSDVSSTSSSSFSSSLLHSPPTHHYSSGTPYIPDHHHHLYQHHAQYHSRHHHSFQQQEQKQDTHDWTPVNSQKSLSGLLHLANIVSTFG